MVNPSPPQKCDSINGKTYCCPPSAVISSSGKKVQCRSPTGDLTPAKIKVAPFNWIVVLSYVTVIVMNALASLLPLNGMDTGEISDMYPNYFTPTGLTFAIWGLIYLLLGAYVIYQLPYTPTDQLKRVNLLFVISCGCNALWIVAWHYLLLWLSTILMLGLFISLTLIYLTLHPDNKGLYPRQTGMILLPFSVYYGWISVATAAQLTITFKEYGFKGFGLSEPVWTVIVLVLLTFIAIFMTSLKGDVVYVGVVLWAAIGILLKRIQDTADPQPIIVTTVIIGMVFLSFEILFGIYRNLKKIQFLCPA